MLSHQPLMQETVQLAPVPWSSLFDLKKILILLVVARLGPWVPLNLKPDLDILREHKNVKSTWAQNELLRSLVSTSDDSQHVPVAKIKLTTGDLHPLAARHLPVVHRAPHIGPIFIGLIGVEGVTLSLFHPHSPPGPPLGSTSCDSFGIKSLISTFTSNPEYNYFSTLMCLH